MPRVRRYGAAPNYETEDSESVTDSIQSAATDPRKRHSPRHSVRYDDETVFEDESNVGERSYIGDERSFSATSRSSFGGYPSEREESREESTNTRTSTNSRNNRARDAYSSVESRDLRENRNLRENTRHHERDDELLAPIGEYRGRKPRRRGKDKLRKRTSKSLPHMRSRSFDEPPRPHHVSTRSVASESSAGRERNRGSSKYYNDAPVQFDSTVKQYGDRSYLSNDAYRSPPKLRRARSSSPSASSREHSMNSRSSPSMDSFIDSQPSVSGATWAAPLVTSTKLVPSHMPPSAMRTSTRSRNYQGDRNRARSRPRSTNRDSSRSKSTDRDLSNSRSPEKIRKKRGHRSTQSVASTQSARSLRSHKSTQSKSSRRTRNTRGSKSSSEGTRATRPSEEEEKGKFAFCSSLCWQAFTVIIVALLVGGVGGIAYFFIKKGGRTSVISEKVQLVSRSSLIQNASTPQAKALNWILTEDQKQIGAHDLGLIERYIAAVLYFSTDGDAWNKNDGWLSEKDTCMWTGLTCGGVGTDKGIRVISLDYNQLKGSIPVEISEITFLEEINFAGNSLTGKIPRELSRLIYLRALYLQYNNLKESIPDDIFMIRSLNTLHVHWNILTGTIPTTIEKAVSLQSISLSGNNIFGEIPTSIRNVYELEELWLWSTNITGTLPEELFDLEKLKVLDFGQNQLHGTISGNIANLVNLRELHLDNNNFYGTIPPTLGNIKGLEILALDGNNFYGTIHDAICTLRSLLLEEFITDCTKEIKCTCCTECGPRTEENE